MVPAMARQRDQRYQTTREMLEALIEVGYQLDLSKDVEITGPFKVLRSTIPPAPRTPEDIHAVAETVNRLLEVTRAHAGFALRPSGEQALANALHVAEQARAYEGGGGISFRGFVERLNEDAEGRRTPEAPDPQSPVPLPVTTRTRTRKPRRGRRQPADPPQPAGVRAAARVKVARQAEQRSHSASATKTPTATAATPTPILPPWLRSSKRASVMIRRAGG